AWAMHVGTLLEEAGLGENPALVDALLAPLTPDVFAHQRAEGLPAERLVAGLSLLARRALAG
ncbi:MAG: TetR/AcrR family transcriptional regulator, partial [Thermoleophilaceae bacterium]